jgi:hypothetical protein
LGLPGRKGSWERSRGNDAAKGLAARNFKNCRRCEEEKNSLGPRSDEYCMFR